VKINAKQLLEAGSHFGHRKNKWNPRMEKFIYTVRNNIHIINIEQTVKLLEDAVDFVQEIVKNNGNILFVGTKKQAQNAIEEEAQRCGMPYISYRWWGGLFSNFKQILFSIDRYKDLQKNLETYNSNKKIYAKKTRVLAKLDRGLKGLVNLYELPQAIYIVDPIREEIAVKEAKMLNVPIIALLDTDCNPDIIDYPIPANDDALRSVKLITQLIADAVLEAKGIPQKAEEPEEKPEEEQEQSVEQEEENGSND